MLIKPHGKHLVYQIPQGQEKKNIYRKAITLPRLIISDSLKLDVRNIARGLYSPISGFLCKKDFENVVKKCKLANDITWPIPIVLDVDRNTMKKIKNYREITLYTEHNRLLAILKIKEIFTFNKKTTAKNIYGTQDEKHPGVKKTFSMKDFLVGGDIFLLNNTKEPFNMYNLEPKETRVLFKIKGWKRIAAFQTRNIPHRGHEYLQRCALEIVDGLFINPAVGKKKIGDFTTEAILAAYEYMIKNIYPRNTVVMSVLPTDMRYAGPREALFHAIIRKNFGCTHFIIGRDHAGVGNYYGPYDAQKIFKDFDDIEIKLLPFENSFYCKKCGIIATGKTCRHANAYHVNPSGTYIRKLFEEKRHIPNKIIRKEIVGIIKKQKKLFVN